MWQFLSVISTTLRLRSPRCPHCGARQFDAKRDSLGRVICWRCKRTFTPQRPARDADSR